MFKANNPTTFDEAVFDNRIYDCFEFDNNPGTVRRPRPTKPYQKKPR